MSIEEEVVITHNVVDLLQNLKIEVHIGIGIVGDMVVDVGYIKIKVIYFIEEDYIQNISEKTLVRVEDQKKVYGIDIHELIVIRKIKV